MMSTGLPCDQLGGKHLVELFDGGIGQGGDGQSQIGGAVGRHHAGATAVGDDGQSVADRAKSRGQRLGGGKQLA